MDDYHSEMLHTAEFIQKFAAQRIIFGFTLCLGTDAVEQCISGATEHHHFYKATLLAQTQETENKLMVLKQHPLLLKSLPSTQYLKPGYANTSSYKGERAISHITKNVSPWRGWRFLDAK